MIVLRNKWIINFIRTTSLAPKLGSLSSIGVLQEKIEPGILADLIGDYLTARVVIRYLWHVDETKRKLCNVFRSLQSVIKLFSAPRRFKNK